MNFSHPDGFDRGAGETDEAERDRLIHRAAKPAGERSEAMDAALTPEQKALVDELVKDGLAIQHKSALNRSTSEPARDIMKAAPRTRSKTRERLPVDLNHELTNTL